jgi:uncharacterized membrane protein (UPF0127 family)
VHPRGYGLLFPYQAQHRRLYDMMEVELPLWIVLVALVIALGAFLTLLK